MGKVKTTINLDKEVKEEAIGFLKNKGWALSFYIEQSLRKFNESERIKKEEETNVISKEEERGI